MIDRLKKFECCGCEACFNVCPVEAIQMKQDQEGFYYPEIRHNICISCNKCEKVCPAINSGRKKGNIFNAYACFYQNEAVRKQSTSGGMFSAIAEKFLEKKAAIVYGVKFDQRFCVKYGKTCKQEELFLFRGSKYVQCRAEKIFTEIKDQLEAGKNVLFSGMPCQVEALICFLGKDYGNLYTIDMICFGIASPLVWNLYLNEFHKRGEIEQIIFKDKRYGWKKWSVKFKENGIEKYFQKNENLYMNSYIQRINIRPSCYQCKYKGIERKSDFTIADCWGIGEQNIRLNDDNGLSAILIHTEKGKKFFELIKRNIEYEEYEPDELMQGNWATYHSPEEGYKRKEFFEKIKVGDIKEAFMMFEFR